MSEPKEHGAKETLFRIVSDGAIVIAAISAACYYLGLALKHESLKQLGIPKSLVPKSELSEVLTAGFQFAVILIVFGLCLVAVVYGICELMSRYTPLVHACFRKAWRNFIKSPPQGWKLAGLVIIASVFSIMLLTNAISWIVQLSLATNLARVPQWPVVEITTVSGKAFDAKAFEFMNSTDDTYVFRDPSNGALYVIAKNDVIRLGIKPED